LTPSSFVAGLSDFIHIPDAVVDNKVVSSDDFADYDFPRFYYLTYPSILILALMFAHLILPVVIALFVAFIGCKLLVVHTCAKPNGDVPIGETGDYIALLASVGLADISLLLIIHVISSV